MSATSRDSGPDASKPQFSPLWGGLKVIFSLVIFCPLGRRAPCSGLFHFVFQIARSQHNTWRGNGSWSQNSWTWMGFMFVNNVNNNNNNNHVLVYKNYSLIQCILLFCIYFPFMWHVHQRPSHKQPATRRNINVWSKISEGIKPAGWVPIKYRHFKPADPGFGIISWRQSIQTYSCKKKIKHNL